MPERNGHWNGLTEAEQQKVISELRRDPSLLAQLADAAQSGDILAAEAILAYGEVIVVPDTNRPENSYILPHRQPKINPDTTG